MARKKKEIESGGGGNWMDTYGDMVTLLLCFFVLLFSFSTMDAEKWQSLVGAFSGAASIQIPSFTPEMAFEKPIELIVRSDITGEDDDDGIGGDGGPSAQELIDYENFKALVEGIEGFMDGQSMTVDIEAKYDNYVIIIRFDDKILFNSGSDQLLPASEPILDQMAQLLATFDELIYRVRVEGHTDNRPIRTSKFNDNWDLSSYRANNVVRHLRQTGIIDTKKVYSAGWGDEYPIDTNETPEGQANNRRVEFVIESTVQTTRWNPNE